MTAQSYNTILDTKISGIPCKVGVKECHVVPSWRGSPWTCDSDMDFYGYSDVDFEVLDRKGYPANWLAKKMTPSDIRRIEALILKDYEEMMDDQDDYYHD